MSFFKKLKRKSADVGGGGKVSQSPSASSLHDHPPMHSFLPPPDLVKDTLETSRRGMGTLEDVLAWGKEYWMAFLQTEGAVDLMVAWENVGEESLLRIENLLGKDVMDELLKESQDCKKKEMLSQVLQQRYFPKYLESRFHVKSQMDIFTGGGNVSLYDILLNQNALFYFMEYVEQEGKTKVLEFWLGATNFAEQWKSPSTNEDSKQAVSDAMVLYEKYISLQAPHPIGLRDEVRCEVEAKICSEEEVRCCFNSAILEAFVFLQVTCLDGFLKSSLFLTFLSDLIGSLNSSRDDRGSQQNDASSVGSSGSIKSYPVSSGSSVTSPLGFSPRERERSKLTMGRVNALGKFEPDVEWDIFKKESGITKTVKKLVNFDDKEKAKEELAWQVASMIINEVTSVTMGPISTHETT